MSDHTDLGAITVTKITAARIVKNRTYPFRQIVDRRWHGLCFCKSGRMVYTMHGKDYISKPGTVLILPRGGTYTSLCSEAGEFPLVAEGIAVRPNVRRLHLVLLVELPEPITQGFEGGARRVGEPGTYGQNGLVVAKMERLSYVRPPTMHLSTMRILYEILHRLQKSVISAGEEKRFEAILPAVRYLEEHFTDSDLHNALLADKAFISEVYFRKLFREKFDMSPKQYIQKLRIKKAEGLLSRESLSVSAVAEATGFASVYHFSRTFKKETGYSPSDYAKRFRENAFN